MVLLGKSWFLGLSYLYHPWLSWAHFLCEHIFYVRVYVHCFLVQLLISVLLLSLVFLCLIMFIHWKPLGQKGIVYQIKQLNCWLLYCCKKIPTSTCSFFVVSRCEGVSFRTGLGMCQFWKWVCYCVIFIHGMVPPHRSNVCSIIVRSIHNTLLDTTSTRTQYIFYVKKCDTLIS